MPTEISFSVSEIYWRLLTEIDQRLYASFDPKRPKIKALGAEYDVAIDFTTVWQRIIGIPEIQTVQPGQQITAGLPGRHEVVSYIGSHAVSSRTEIYNRFKAKLNRAVDKRFGEEMPWDEYVQRFANLSSAKKLRILSSLRKLATQDAALFLMSQMIEDEVKASLAPQDAYLELRRSIGRFSNDREFS